MIVNCDFCGKEYDVFPSQLKHYKHHFCSPECNYKYKTKEKTIGYCKNCGVIIYKTPSDVRWDKKKYCSKECSFEGRKKQIKIVCEECGKDFHVPQSWSSRRYCSIECKGEASKNSIERHCLQCGKSIMRQKAKARRHQTSFCSKECMRSYMSEYMNEKMREGVHPFQDIEVRRRNNIKQSKNKHGLTYIENILFNSLLKHGIIVVPDYRVEYIRDSIHRKRYIWLDLCIPDRKIDIECDGEYWHSSDVVKDKDKKRDAYLIENGWLVLRFTGSELKNDIGKCVDMVINTINKRIQ